MFLTGRVRCRSSSCPTLQARRPETAAPAQGRSGGAGRHSGPDRFRVKLTARHEQREYVQTPAGFAPAIAQHLSARFMVARCGRLANVCRAKGKVVMGF